MADAVAAVLLISADYLASGFCIKEEVPYLLNRQEREGMLKDNEDPDPKKRWLEQLRTRLKPLEFDGQLTICSDQEIAIGKALIEMNDGEQERTLLAVANRIEQIVQGASQNP